jgi:2-keto-4-pentenoate hydratase/2-oxohepta-3-ene-1,7-dioic acid hydratase in catechol pathway
MKWCRWVREGQGFAGQEFAGLVGPDGTLHDASGLTDINGLLATSMRADPVDWSMLPTVDPQNVTWCSPIGRPGKVICIGLNYSDHAEEAGMAEPEEPIVFLKASNTIVGPHDPVFIPRGGEKTDWEVELGVVIGKEAKYLADEAAAAEVIAGYCLSHDVSERAFQLERGGQWTKGKSCDTFNPLGPWLVTPDEIDDVQNLGMELTVNGEVMQHGNTSKMIFSVFTIVHYLSQFMTLEPGDLINTGTPPGVGMGMKPPRYLRAGDRVSLSIDGLGKQQCVVEAA